MSLDLSHLRIASAEIISMTLKGGWGKDQAITINYENGVFSISTTDVDDPPSTSRKLDPVEHRTLLTVLQRELENPSHDLDHIVLKSFFHLLTDVVIRDT